VRALLWRQHRLRHAERGECLHLHKSLTRGLARIGRDSRIALGGDVAEGKAGVVVRGTDKAVEVGFEGVVGTCGGHSVTPGGSAPGRCGSAASLLATG
jgi:hypothetical protein